jgi:hypothetical protein
MSQWTDFRHRKTRPFARGHAFDDTGCSNIASIFHIRDRDAVYDDIRSPKIHPEDVHGMGDWREFAARIQREYEASEDLRGGTMLCEGLRAICFITHVPSHDRLKTFICIGRTYLDGDDFRGRHAFQYQRLMPFIYHRHRFALIRRRSGNPP